MQQARETIQRGDFAMACRLLDQVEAQLQAAAPAPTLAAATGTQPTPTPPPTPTLVPAPTPTPPPGPYYGGPLFDTHLHLRASQIWPRFDSADALLRYFDRNQELGAIGFYIFYPYGSHFETRTMPVVTGARHRVIPLFQPWPADIAPGRFTEEFLRGYLQPQGPFQGVGELAFFGKDLQTVPIESPVIQTFFQLVHQIKGIVMAHSSRGAGQVAQQMQVAEWEPSIRKYSDVLFLFHGGLLDFDVAAQLMSKYPNVYFTLDACPWLFTNALTDSVFTCEPVITGSGAGSSERFLAEVNRIGLDRLIEEGLSEALPRIRQYPDRIMWGTDRSPAWNFEDAITDVIIQASRQFIGRLPIEIQEKYAYGNAQRVFGRNLSPGP